LQDPSGKASQSLFGNNTSPSIFGSIPTQDKPKPNWGLFGVKKDSNE
jgi:hypothetical protein